MPTYSILIKPLLPNTAMRDLTRAEVNRLRACGVSCRTNWAVTSDGQIWEPAPGGGMNSVRNTRACSVSPR